MAEITLLRGQVALVDDEDLPKVAGYRWRLSSKGYVVTSVGSWRDGTYRLIYLHRLVMNGAQLDHRRQDSKLDNRKENLRPATCSQNAANRCSPRMPKTSRFKGVFWNTAKSKWQAVLGLVTAGRSKKLYIGRFDDEKIAALAYNEAAKQHFGNFALLNEV